jgi:hypothetical protein
MDADAEQPDIGRLSLISVIPYATRQAIESDETAISAYRPSFKSGFAARRPHSRIVFPRFSDASSGKTQNELVPIHDTKSVDRHILSVFLDTEQISGYSEERESISFIHVNQFLLQHIFNPSNHVVDTTSENQVLLWTRWDTGELCLINIHPLGLEESGRNNRPARFMHLEIQPLLPCTQFQSSLEASSRPLVLGNPPIFNPECLPVDHALIHDPNMLTEYYFDLQTNSIPSVDTMRQIAPHHVPGVEKYWSTVGRTTTQLDTATSIFMNSYLMITKQWNSVILLKSLFQLVTSLPSIPLNVLSFGWSLAPDINAFPSNEWHANNQWILIDNVEEKHFGQQVDSVEMSDNTDYQRSSSSSLSEYYANEEEGGQQQENHNLLFAQLQKEFEWASFRKQFISAEPKLRELSPLVQQFVQNATHYLQSKSKQDEEEVYGFSLSNQLHVYILALIEKTADLDSDSKLVPLLAILPLLGGNRNSRATFYFNQQLLHSEIIGHLDDQLQPVISVPHSPAPTFQIRLIHGLNFNDAWHMTCLMPDLDSRNISKLVDEAAFFRRAPPPSSTLSPVWQINDHVTEESAECLVKVRRNQNIFDSSWKYKL